MKVLELTLYHNQYYQSQIKRGDYPRACCSHKQKFLKGEPQYLDVHLGAQLLKNTRGTDLG